MEKLFTSIFKDIKSFKHNDLFTAPKIYTNLEIIKHFNWIGELGEKY